MVTLFSHSLICQVLTSQIVMTRQALSHQGHPDSLAQERYQHLAVARSLAQQGVSLGGCQLVIHSRESMARTRRPCSMAGATTRGKSGRRWPGAFGMMAAWRPTSFGMTSGTSSIPT